MSGFTQVLSTLTAVAVGALATYLAGAATERTRWRRERSARWDDRRAQAYADYARAVKNVHVQCMRAHGLRRKGTGARAAYEEALTELERLTDDRTAKWETVLLLGDPETIEAGTDGDRPGRRPREPGARHARHGRPRPLQLRDDHRRRRRRRGLLHPRQGRNRPPRPAMAP